MKFNEIVNEVIDRSVQELQGEENVKKIKHDIIKPIINFIVDELYPYLITTVIIFVLTLLVAILILILVLKQQ